MNAISPPKALSNGTYLVVGSVWATMALSLLRLGYGSDPDTWEVARVAEHFFTQHEYLVSRSSGFPLFEISAAPFVHTGSFWIANALSFFAATVLLGAFISLARAGHFNHPNLVVVTFALLPVVVKNATSLIDYTSTLAILMWAYIAMTRGRLYITASLVGIACGFRPTSAIMMAPVLVHVWFERRSVALAAKLAALSAAAAIAAYSPVLLTYGLRTGYKAMALSPSAHIMMAGYNALTLLGALQTVIAVGVVAHAIMTRTPGKRAFGRARHTHFHLTALGVYGALFLLMPHEPEYLLPIVPSLLILVDGALDERRFSVVSAVLLSYHAVRVELLGGTSGHRVMTFHLAPGYTYRDIQARRFSLSLRAAATAYRPEQPTIFMSCVDEIAGNNPAFERDERLGMFKQREGRLFVSVVIVRNERLAAFRAKGFRLVIWKGQEGELVFRRRGDDSWKNYVEEITSLDELFGKHVEGAPLY